MGVTAIKQVVNRSAFTLVLTNSENPDKFRNGGLIEPYRAGEVDMWVPWANPGWGGQLERHHISLQLSDTAGVAATFRIYQHATVDGDYVRIVRWGDDDGRGFVVPQLAYSRIGGLADVNGDRRMLIADNGFATLERF